MSKFRAECPDRFKLRKIIVIRRITLGVFIQTVHIPLRPERPHVQASLSRKGERWHHFCKTLEIISCSLTNMDQILTGMFQFNVKSAM